MKYEFDYVSGKINGKEQHQFVVKNSITMKQVARFLGETKEIAEMNLMHGFLLLSDFTGKDDLKDIAYNYIQTYDLPDCLK